MLHGRIREYCVCYDLTVLYNYMILTGIIVQPDFTTQVYNHIIVICISIMSTHQQTELGNRTMGVVAGHTPLITCCDQSLFYGCSG